MIVQIAAPAPVRIRQAFSFDAKHRAALRAFGDLELLLAIQPGHRKFCAERGLRNADGNRAIQICAAPLEERMLFDFEHDIKVAARTAIRPRLAFAGNAKARSRVHAWRNAQLDGFLALHAPLASAFRATLFDDLARALAGRACARNGEESLLIRQLPAS